MAKQEPTDQNAEESDILQAADKSGQAHEPEEDFDDELAGRLLGQMLTTDEPEKQPESAPTDKQDDTQEDLEIINDEITAKYPAAKSLKGMTPEQIAKSYAELQAFHTRKVNELQSQLKAKPASPPDEPKQAMSDEELKDFIDMTPAEQKAYLDRRDEMLIQKITERMSMQLAPVQELKNQKAQEALLTEIQKVTPEGMTAAELLQDWRDANRDRLFNPGGTLKQNVIAFYDENPDELIYQLRTHAELKELGKVKKDKNMEVYRQTKQVLNNSVKPLPRVPVNPPREVENKDRIDDALLTIAERATENEL